MRILALTKYTALAASTRQRFAQYAPYLRSHGIEVEIAPLLTDAYIQALNAGRTNRFGLPAGYLKRLAMLLKRRDYDLLWVQYELFPFLPGWFERLATRAGKPIVCDYDDAIFHTYDASGSSLVRRLLGRKLEPLLSRAAAVICGNRYIEDYASRFCPNTIVIPTVVDTEVYVPPAPGSARAPTPLIGWLGAPSTWVFVQPVLSTVLEVANAAGTSFRAVGAGRSAVPHPGLELADWSEATEVSELQRFDIGIMPLQDHPFQRGKCGYKLIQYMACGVPVIASPVGVNSEIVVHGETGFLATTQAERAEALRRLLGDADLRRRMGQAGRRRVEELYSLQVQQPRLLDLFRSIEADARRGLRHASA